MTSNIDLTNSIADMQNGFSRMGDALRRTVPENIFVHHFLPVFSGQKTDDIDNILEYWIRISNGPMNSVAVVDTLGQIKVVVPPLHNNLILNPDKSEDVNIAYAAKEAKAREGYAPVMAQSILAQALGKKYGSMLDVSPNETNDEQWRKVFETYGISNAVPPVNSVDIEDDAFGF